MDFQTVMQTKASSCVRQPRELSGYGDAVEGKDVGAVDDMQGKGERLQSEGRTPSWGDGPPRSQKGEEGAAGRDVFVVTEAMMLADYARQDSREAGSTSQTPVVAVARGSHQGQPNVRGRRDDQVGSDGLIWSWRHGAQVLYSTVVAPLAPEASPAPAPAPRGQTTSTPREDARGMAEMRWEMHAGSAQPLALALPVSEEAMLDSLTSG